MLERYDKIITLLRKEKHEVRTDAEAVAYEYAIAALERDRAKVEKAEHALATKRGVRVA